MDAFFLYIECSIYYLCHIKACKEAKLLNHSL